MKNSFFSKIYNYIQKKNILKKFKIVLYYFDSLLLLWIKKPKYSNHGKKKVLVIYNLALGDGVIFNCSSKDYRSIYPKDEYQLDLLCQNGVQNLYVDNEIFDNVIHLDFMKAAVNPVIRFKNYKIIRKTYYDIVIDPIGIFECTTNVLLTRATVSKKKIGILDENKEIFLNKRIYSKIYTDIYTIKKDKILSLIEYYQKVIYLVSNKKITHDVGFVPLKTKKIKTKIPKKYFVIFPSASIELKRWPIERYREIAKMVYEKLHIPLVVCGTAIDRVAVNDLISDLDIDVINLLGKTSINDYFEVIKNASFVITNDTSAYHIALSFQTPVIIISGGYDFDRYIEYNFKRKEEFKKPYIVAKKKKCFNCHEFCPYFNNEDKIWKCLDEITVHDVEIQINKLIEDERLGDENEFGEQIK